MKFTKVFVASLMAGTAYADTPWAFFAKAKAKANDNDNDNDIKKYLPLSGKSLGKANGLASIFTYGDSDSTVVEFFWDRNDPYTSTGFRHSNVGYYREQLVFGPSIASGLKIQDDGKVVDQAFYLCDYKGSKMQKISLKDVSSDNVKCQEVKLYLLPYNKETKSSVFSMAYSFKKSTTVNGVEEPCQIHYDGEGSHDDLTSFLNVYEGPCDIHLNGVQMRKKLECDTDYCDNAFQSMYKTFIGWF